MYLGQIMEIGPADAIYAPPYHPYTEALLSAVPIPDPTAEQKHIRLEGSVPSAINPPSGCRFHTRCWLREQLGNPEQCQTAEPELRDVGGGHLSACHYAEDVTAETVARAAERQAQETAAALLAGEATIADEGETAGPEPDAEPGDEPVTDGSGADRGMLGRVPRGAGVLLRGGRKKRSK